MSNWSWPRFFITAVVGLLVALAYHVALGRRTGTNYEQVVDRVVEETSDESAKIKTLVDEHARILRERDDATRSLRDDHDKAVAALQAEHEAALDAALSAHRTETTRLQGLVTSLEPAKQEVANLQAQLTQQKDEYTRLERDWKRRVDDAEAKVGAHMKLAEEPRPGQDS